MSPVVNLARRASPSPRGTINDENVHTTSSGRASRSGLKDLKSVWAGQAMRLRGSSGDGSFRKRAPLSNTTNTSNNRPGSQIYRDNELADSSADFDATTAEELNLSSSIDRQRASSVMPQGSPFPFGSPLQDDSRKRLTAPATPVSTAAVNQPSPNTPRLSSEENHGGSSKGSSPRRRADLSINVEAANARRNQGRLSTPSRDTGGPPTIPRGATHLGSSPSHTQAVAPRPRPHDTASPSASDKGHMLGAPQPSPSVESSLINHATVAVLQERFGVSHINQLPPETSRELLGGGLVSLVVKYIRQIAEKDASVAQNLAPQGRFDDARSPTPPLILSPPPFPADALPSEIQLEQNTNLYLSGLSESMTDDQLLRLGTQYGDVISHKAIINSETGLCKGYGFVMYAKAKDAAVAMVELQRQGFLTSFARHESFSAKLRSMADSKSTNVYVSNLPLDLDDQQLAALVQPHTIVSRRILTKPDGTSRGVGFIRFQTREIAQDCIDRLHGKRLPHHPHPLQARFADSETQKRLKQDTTLRKVYADLDMGRLQTPMRGPSSAVEDTDTSLDSSSFAQTQQAIAPQEVNYAPPELPADRRLSSANLMAPMGSFSHAMVGSPVWDSLGSSTLPFYPGVGGLPTTGSSGSLADASKWPSFSPRAAANGAGSTSRQNSPRFEAPFWGGFMYPGLSPATSANSLNTMSPALPEVNNFLSMGQKFSPLLENERRRSLQATSRIWQQQQQGHHQQQTHGLGIANVSDRTNDGGFPATYPSGPGVPESQQSQIDQMSLSMDTAKLTHQVQRALGQPVSSSGTGSPSLRGHPMYAPANIESLSGREAFRAAGFVRASEQKAAIPIIDPATRQAAYEASAAAAAQRQSRQMQHNASTYSMGLNMGHQSTSALDHSHQVESRASFPAGMSSSLSLSSLMPPAAPHGNSGTARLSPLGGGREGSYRFAGLPHSQSSPGHLDGLGGRSRARSTLSERRDASSGPASGNGGSGA